MKRAYLINPSLIPSSLPWSFDGEKTLFSDGNGYVEVNGSLPSQFGVEVSIRNDNSIPHSVSRFQARAALYQFGLLSMVETIMASDQVDAISKLAWEDAQEFLRDSPTVVALGAMLGLNSTQLDNLFIVASSIKA